MTFRFSLRRVVASWPFLGLILGAVLLIKSLVGQGTINVTAEAALPVTTASHYNTDVERHAFRPIEAIRVGQRVITDLPEGILDIDGQPFNRSLSDGKTRVDPDTWRLRAETTWEDGTVDDVNIETLQPPEWIESNDIRVGGNAPIPLDLVEMGLPRKLTAKIVADLPCPPVESGPGRVVLTTVNHLNPAVMEIAVCNNHGRTETIHPTATHRFYSLDRGTWVTTDELTVNERLQGLTDDVRIVSITFIPGVHRVYNMTVEGEHVYRVSRFAVSAHNNCPGGSSNLPGTILPATVPNPRYQLPAYDPHSVLDDPKWWGLPAEPHATLPFIPSPGSSSGLSYVE
jgi:hypothetical protein